MGFAPSSSAIWRAAQVLVCAHCARRQYDHLGRGRRAVRRRLALPWRRQHGIFLQIGKQKFHSELLIAPKMWHKFILVG
jgi:hypothetical protein